MKTIDRAHAGTQIKPRSRKPLTWALLVAGRGAVEGLGNAGQLIWKGLALSYLLLCRASEIWAYETGLVQSEFCLTRQDLVFFKGVEILAWEVRRGADRVEVTFRASEEDQKRVGAVVTRAGVGLQVVLDLLDLCPQLGRQAPLVQWEGPLGSKVVARSEATRALRLLVSSVGRNSPCIRGGLEEPRTWRVRGRPKFRSKGQGDGNRRPSWYTYERGERARSSFVCAHKSRRIRGDKGGEHEISDLTDGVSSLLGQRPRKNICSGLGLGNGVSKKAQCLSTHWGFRCLWGIFLLHVENDNPEFLSKT